MTKSEQWSLMATVLGPVFALAVACSLLGFTAGASWVAATPPSRNLTTEELSHSRLEQKLPPMDIVVHLVPDVNKYCDSSVTLGGAYACATGSRTCDVYIPSDISVVFFPTDGTAYWDNPYDGNTLAHEFLHCVYPNWHQPYTNKVIAIKKLMKDK